MRGSRSGAAVRAACVLAGVAVLTVAASPAFGGDNASFKLPAHVIFETEPIEDPISPERCLGAAFAEFPHIRGAIGYAVTLDDLQFGFDGTRTGPPFPDDALVYGSVTFVAPAGFHRFFLSGISHPSGCAQAIAELEGRWKITRSRFSMSEAFTERWRKPVGDCYFRTLTPIEGPVVIGRPGKPVLLRQYGERDAFVTIDGVRTRLHDNLLTTRPVTIEVGEGTIVRVTGFHRAAGPYDIPGWKAPPGSPVVIGPGTTVRVKAGRPIEVLERTPGSDLRDVPRSTSVRFLRPPANTSNCVVAARG